MRRLEVLVVDAQPAVRVGLRTLLAGEPGLAWAGTAASAAEAHDAWRAARSRRPDVVLVGRHLPDDDGLALCLWLTTQADPAAVVICSELADDALTLPAVVAGAHALVATSSEPAALCDTVRVVAAGERRLPPVVPQVADEQGAHIAAADLPILGMLRHAVPPAEIAATLRIGEAELTARRWAMLEALTTAPSPSAETRWTRRLQPMRTASPFRATTSPGWS